ncbi:MAG: hypothetical protein L3J91_01155, partial [Thermoplasmata archaeon]|nr:hypothetical protein [Thermoplasmata archaeon]
MSARDADAPLPLGYFDFNATPRAPWLVLNSSHSVYPEPLQGLGTPPAPQSLTAVGGPGSVTLNWTVPAGGAAPTTFVLQYGPPANPNQSMIRVDGYVNSAT